MKRSVEQSKRVSSGLYNMQDSNYWKNRPVDDPQKDWTYGENDWLQGYVLSFSHPHRQLILNEIEGSYLLEIGCNVGPNLTLIRDKFPEMALFGMDISSIAIEKAKKIQAPNIDLFVGNYDSLPYSDNYFDVVVADATLIYSGPKEIKKVLDEINRVVKTKVVLIERYAPTLKGKEVGHVWGRDYKRLFERMGFQVTETKLTEKEWPDSKNWQKYGRLYVCRRA
jgi:ubiquinone/menaquinone biosynthesis C-methylase UbiE